MGPQSFRLFDLPTELRLQIYDYLTPEPRPSNTQHVFDACQALQLIKQPVLQTCRALRSDILHQQFSSRRTVIFISSPGYLTFDFLLAGAAYSAITQTEFLVHCALETYQHGSKRILFSDHQQTLFAAAISFTDKTISLRSVKLVCYVYPGVMQLPRKPELYKLFEDFEVLQKLAKFSPEVSWVPSTTAHSSRNPIYPDDGELRDAALKCEQGLRMRLPDFISRGVQYAKACTPHSQPPGRRMQTSSNFGRHAHGVRSRNTIW